MFDNEEQKINFLEDFIGMLNKLEEVDFIDNDTIFTIDELSNMLQAKLITTQEKLEQQYSDNGWW